MERITDHVPRALSRLAQQYRGKPKLAGTVTVLAKQIQEIEDMLFSILAETVDQAVGAQLDVLGRIVGEERLGDPDSNYRLRIKAGILLNVSSGTPEELLAIFRLLTSDLPGAVVQFEEQYPAALVVRILRVRINSPSTFAGILQAAKDAGVRALLELSSGGSGNGFCFQGGIGRGFPDAQLTRGSGGKFATVLD